MRLIDDLSKLLLALAVAALGLLPLAGPSHAADAAPVKLDSLRNGLPLQQDLTPSNPRQDRDRGPMDRDFVQQPPLIPHTINNYQITRNFNKCMDCHALSKAKEHGATRVSITHYRTRDGKELDSISPLRYFCTQCHVPQTDARALVENTFQKARGLQ